MAKTAYTGSGFTYLPIVQGKFHQSVEEGTPGAFRRDWETKDGAKGTKWELIFNDVEGIVSDIKFQDGEYGESLHIVVDKDIISINTDSKYFVSLAERLRGVDFSKPVKFVPYDFESEGKRMTGISVQQDGEKIPSQYWNPETKENLHGMPVPENAEEFDKDDWKAFFIRKKKFLKKEIRNIVENTNFSKEVVSQPQIVEAPEKEEAPEMPNNAKEVPTIDYDKDRPSPEDLPF